MSDLRKDQERIEVSPGNFVWMDKKDRKAFAEKDEAKPEHPDPENASTEAPENASMPRSQSRPAKKR